MLLPSSLVAGQTATLVYDPRLVDDDPVSLVLGDLAPEAERRSVEAGRIAYPYGPRVSA